MKKEAIIAISIILLTSTSIEADINIKDSWEYARLNKPTFAELQSEVLWQHITCYGEMDDKTINSALNKQFERMEYMYFGDCSILNKEMK